MTADSECVFCGIVAGEIPSTTVAATERVVAFMDINPASRGHALVVPRAHVVDLLEIGSDDLAECGRLAQEIAARAAHRLGADGVNLLNCCGAAAWQTVFHFHIHVIPRYAGRPEWDSIRLPWDPTPGDPEQIRQIGQLLS